MSEYVNEVSDSSFDKDVLQSDKPVLVDFWATWCAPCRMLEPTVDAVAEKYAQNARVVKVNVDDNPSISQRYGIKGIPTLILFKGGKEAERVVGATSKEAISRMIDKHVAGAATAEPDFGVGAWSLSLFFALCTLFFAFRFQSFPETNQTAKYKVPSAKFKIQSPKSKVQKPSPVSIMSKIIVVIGAQWGDEGKGKIVDLLAEHFDIVARYQGGHNAGHSVQVGDQSFLLHLLPSGIVHRGKTCVLGNGMVIDPKAFFEEADRLETQGIEVSPERVKISSRAHLILPYHRALDHTSEERLGNEKVGTTLRGIGPAYEDKYGRRGIRTADALVPDVLRSRIERNLEDANRIIEAY